MSKNNKVYEAIRELILLGFYARNNLNSYSVFLGEYQYEDKKYEIYSYGIQGISIFIKCEDESIHIMVEDNEYIPYINGPTYNDVYLHINSYRNIDIDDIPCDLKNIKKENIIYKSKTKLDYYCCSFMYHNPNKVDQCGIEKQRYKIIREDGFEEKLKRIKCLQIFKDAFSPEIILTLIEQVYPNFEQIYLDNKINGIIDSLSQEELLLLKQKIQEREQGQLVKKLIQLKDSKNK